jgi:tetratricopeptide (TPR) repeat protein
MVNLFIKGGVMRKIIISIFLILTFLCSTAMGITAVDWDKKANKLWNGEKFTNPKKALEYLNNAIKLQPNNALTYLKRAAAYVNLIEYQKALEDFNKAIRLKPDYAYAYNNRGILYLMVGNNELGCRDAQKACKLGICKSLDLAKAKGLCH